MPIISELHYSNAYSGLVNVPEFLEVTLLPGDDPADYTVSFYNATPTNQTPNNGEVGLEVSLTDPRIAVTTDPSNGRSYYVISDRAFDLALTDPDGNGATNYEAFALVDTSGPTNAVLSFYDIGGGSQRIQAVDGAAAGSESVNISVADAPNDVRYTIQFLPSDPTTPIFLPVTEGAPVICFASDTLISTPCGDIPVEHLTPGADVLTECGDTGHVVWVGRKSFTARELHDDPRLRPVLVRAGALGPGQSYRDLRVSQHHRFLVCGPIAQRMFGHGAGLVAAKDMLMLPGVCMDATLGDLTYVHFATGSHGCVLANGAVAETLLPGPMALAALDARARAELLQILDIQDVTALRSSPCRPVFSGKRARWLIKRHAVNGKPLVESTSHIAVRLHS